MEQRRKSCDVISARSSLSTLFDVDDLKSGSENEVTVESKNVGLSRITYTVIDSEKEVGGEIKASSDKLGELDGNDKLEDGEFKTMKEYIDLEFQNKVKKSKDFKEIAGNLLGAASVFTKKLQKWRQKNSKTKKINDGSNGNGKGLVKDNVDLILSQDAGKLGESNSEIVGRRSCDTEPRFSVDTTRISFEEPRASWDGYMIARTIPRLAPMFSVVENGILGNMNRFENQRLSVDGPMHSIVEDESSSGASGSGSGQSNSDSSLSMRQSSFDRSSSVRSFGKKVMSSEDHGVSPANVKLVITEEELKDWQLTYSKDDTLEKFGSLPKNAAGAMEIAGNLSVPAKKPVKWRRVRNLFGLKVRTGDNVIDPFLDGKKGKEEACGQVGDVNNWKLIRSNSVGSRNLCETAQPYHHRRSVDSVDGFGIGNFKMERNKSVRHSPGNLDPPFYMTPLRSLRNSKHGKLKLESPSIAGHVLQLN